MDAVRFLDDQGFTPAIAASVASQAYGTMQNIPSTSSEGVIELSSLEQFNDIVQKEDTVVLDFWSETCPSCKQMLPAFEAVAQELSGQASFITVDIDKVPAVVEKLFVHKVPCLLVLHKGDLIARYNNSMTKKELSAFVGQLLANRA